MNALRRKILLSRQNENTDLNSKEHEERRLILSSGPQRVFLQINAPCNADCVFCSKGYDYPVFRLADYLKTFGRQLTPVLARSREMILSGSGEFLALPDSESILEYFNSRFPHVDKYISTNASHCRPRLWELIAASESKYTLQLSLHSTDKESHRLMMRYDSYDQTMENIRYIAGQRKKTGNPRIYIMFIMTTLNIEKLPDFIRFGAELDADRVMASYFYIYEAQQKYLSLYFKQDLANRMLDEARRVAEELKIDVELPQKFGQHPHPTPCKADVGCPEPWSQIMVNTDGRVLPCDVYGRFEESLLDGKSFFEVWNGPAYREIRKSLREKRGCILTCPRQNPSGINNWSAHVIHRHKDEKLIVKEYERALEKP